MESDVNREMVSGSKMDVVNEQNKPRIVLKFETKFLRCKELRLRQNKSLDFESCCEIQLLIEALYEEIDMLKNDIESKYGAQYLTACKCKKKHLPMH